MFNWLIKFWLLSYHFLVEAVLPFARLAAAKQTQNHIVTHFKNKTPKS